MKKLVVLLFAFVFSFGCLAQDAKRHEPAPEQKLAGALLLFEATTALVVGPVALPVALLTGQRRWLCDSMKGIYDPRAADQCAGGEWLRLIPYLRE